jgi:hypothetical protein
MLSDGGLQAARTRASCMDIRVFEELIEVQEGFNESGLQGVHLWHASASLTHENNPLPLATACY